MSERSRASYLLIGCTYAASAWLVACGGGGDEEQLLAQAPPGQRNGFIESRQDHGTGNIIFTFAFSEDIKTTPAFPVGDLGLFTADDVEIVTATEDGASAPNGDKVAFAMLSASSATLEVAPSTGRENEAVKISIAPGTFDNLAGITNRLGAEFTHRPRPIISGGASLFTCSQGGNQLHFDCRGTVYEFIPFNGIELASPEELVTAADAASAATGAHDRFLQVTKPAASGVLQVEFSGVIIDQPRAASGVTLTPTDTQMIVRIWSPIATNFLLKLEDAPPKPERSAEATADIFPSEVNKWVYKAFDFTAPVTNQSYDRVALFPSFGASGPAAAGTFYFDEVYPPAPSP